MRLVLASGTTPARTRAIASWIRAFVPAVVLTLVPPGSMPDGDPTDTADDLVTIDADAVASGPLSLADLLARASHRS